MNIIVADRQQAERGLRVGGPWIMISIADPGAPKVCLPPHPLLRDVLRLRFDDAQPGDQPPIWAKPLRLMTAHQARAIWQFALRHMVSVHSLAVQCEAGWSRSPAVAAAIAYAIGEDAASFVGRFSPNLLVFRMMIDHMPRRLRTAELMQAAAQRTPEAGC